MLRLAVLAVTLWSSGSPALARCDDVVVTVRDGSYVEQVRPTYPRNCFW